MGKKKKQSFLFKAGKKIIDLFRWIFRSIFNIIKAIFGLIKKQEEKEVKKYRENLRPKIEPKFEGFFEVEQEDGQLKEIENKLYSNKSTIGLILGARGSGKSAVGMKILENVSKKTKKRTYAIGFNNQNLPKWIRCITSIKEIKENSFLLVDEGGIEFSSRSSMSSPNKLLSELILIARHKNLSVLFITQNSANIEINTIRQTDYLILKRPSLLQLDFERKKIKEIYKKVKDKFKKYKSMEGITYIYSEEYRGFATNKLPSFWNKKISKSYSKK